MLKYHLETYKNDQNMGNLLELVKNGSNKERVLASVRSRLGKNNPFLMVTPNPEILLLASEDKNFEKIISGADYKITDGVGVLAAVDFVFSKRVKNIPLALFTYFFQGMGTFFKVLMGKYKALKGREMFLELLGLANKLEYKVCFVGGKTRTLEKAREVLLRSFRKVDIKVFEGPLVNRIGMPVNAKEEQKEDKILTSLKEFKPDFLFVGFGAPKQEYWLNRILKEIKVKGAMAVGGTFDYISGESDLPPVWMEKSGLEWLYRLFKEPKRFKRIINAAVVFPFRIFCYKLGTR